MVAIAASFDVGLAGTLAIDGLVVLHHAAGKLIKYAPDRGPLVDVGIRQTVGDHTPHDVLVLNERHATAGARGSHRGRNAAGCRAEDDDIGRLAQSD